MWSMPHTHKKEISEDQWSSVVELNKAGNGSKVISRSLDIHLSTVRQIVYKWSWFSALSTLARFGHQQAKKKTYSDR